MEELTVSLWLCLCKPEAPEGAGSGLVLELEPVGDLSDEREPDQRRSRCGPKEQVVRSPSWDQPAPAGPPGRSASICATDNQLMSGHTGGRMRRLGVREFARVPLYGVALAENRFFSTRNAGENIAALAGPRSLTT